MNDKPTLQPPISVLVERFPLKETYTLQSVDESLKETQNDLEKLTEVSNEELVYNVIFKEKLNGEPYPQSKAQSFFDWGKEGWDKNEYFVFAIRDPRGEIVGNMDIKSANLESAEIGYLISKDHPGVMTNAVVALCDIAKNAGYKSLYGLTVSDNEKSQNVLLRAGFINLGPVEENGKQYFKFVKKL